MKVKFGSELSEKFYVASRICFVTFVVSNRGDVVTEDTREGLMEEGLCADDLVLVGETMEGMKRRFLI